MNLFQTLRVALRAILRNKLRAFLTTLGIVIGVGAVIAMMAIGAGAKARVEEAFAAMGTNLLIILPGSTSSRAACSGGFGSHADAHLGRPRRHPQRGADREGRRADRSARRMPVVSEEQNWTTERHRHLARVLRHPQLADRAGPAFTQQDVDSGTKVDRPRRDGRREALRRERGPRRGRTVRDRQHRRSSVVGVAAKKGQSATGQDYDDAAFIPFTTFAHKVQGGLGKYLHGSDHASAATSAETTTRAQKDITALLRDRHHLAPGDDDDFSIRNLSEIAGRPAAGHRDDDDCCSRASPRCRSSSAASGS